MNAFKTFKPLPLFLPRDAGEDERRGLNPSVEFILSGVEGLRTGSA
jgi:hypothetical protein